MRYMPVYRTLYRKRYIYQYIERYRRLHNRDAIYQKPALPSLFLCVTLCVCVFQRNRVVAPLKIVKIEKSPFRSLFCVCSPAVGGGYFLAGKLPEPWKVHRNDAQHGEVCAGQSPHNCRAGLAAFCCVCDCMCVWVCVCVCVCLCHKDFSICYKILIDAGQSATVAQVLLLAVVYIYYKDLIFCLHF